MIVKDSQNLVIKWWNTSRDYNTGVMLLVRFCRNKTLVHTLSKKTEQFGRKKLEYELTKAVRLNHLEMPELPPETIEKTGIATLTDKVTTTEIEAVSATETETETEPATATVTETEIATVTVTATETATETEAVSATVTETETATAIETETAPVFEKMVPLVSAQPIGQYPKVIRRLKHEYAELYKARGIKHKEMTAVPDVNSADNNKLRADYLQDIKDASARMDFLYAHIKAYESKNIIPAEDIIWPKPKTDERLTATAPDLSKRRQTLLNANYKDKNLLRFQQIKKADNDNPLPEGPKREKIKLRMQKRLHEINRIENQLVEIEKNANQTL